MESLARGQSSGTPIPVLAPTSRSQKDAVVTPPKRSHRRQQNEDRERGTGGLTEPPSPDRPNSGKSRGHRHRQPEAAPAASEVATESRGSGSWQGEESNCRHASFPDDPGARLERTCKPQAPVLSEVRNPLSRLESAPIGPSRLRFGGAGFFRTPVIEARWRRLERFELSTSWFVGPQGRL